MLFLENSKDISKYNYLIFKPNYFIFFSNNNNNYYYYYYNYLTLFLIIMSYILVTISPLSLPVNIDIKKIKINICLFMSMNIYIN